jgi:pimeloyl-ACP methyl ester carboxylesterase
MEAGLRVHEGGSGEPLLVLLHGLGATGDVWARWWPVLALRWPGRWWCAFADQARQMAQRWEQQP